MKRRNIIRTVSASCLGALFLFPGCGEQKQIDTETIRTIAVEKQMHLLDDEDSPTCSIAIHYQYLTENGETDSIARRINGTVQKRLLGEEFTELSPEEAVDSFTCAYVAAYRKDISEFYKEDLKSDVPKEELPSWYNYEYSLTTRFEDGKEGILNVISETTEYMGGAHPNTWGRWMNFDRSDGRLLTADDVFISGAEASVSRLLLDRLIAEMASRWEDDSIQSQEDLQGEGILTTTDMYVPENFLLQKDRAAFLYNPYDIAPYAVGDIVLYLSYAELEPYLKSGIDK